MHIVREIKKHNHVKVANAMNAIGFYWQKNKRPTNVEKMVQGLPRHYLVRILEALK